MRRRKIAPGNMTCKDLEEDEFRVFSGKETNLVKPGTEKWRDTVGHEARKECCS